MSVLATLRTWGATSDEINRPMAGDGHVVSPMFSATRSISINAEPGQVFPWLRQMGYKRAGWYSYDWIDNLGRKSARSIHPKWQNLDEGDIVPAGPLAFVATIVDPNHAFCLLLQNRRVSFTLAFELSSERSGCRLVSRARSRLDMPVGAAVARLLLEPGDGVMVRRQLIGIKERAEALRTTDR